MKKENKGAKKFVFITASMPDYSPYLQYYFNVFDKNNIEYDVICRNRTGEKLIPNNRLLVYDVPTDDHIPIYKKLFDFFGFFLFAYKHLRRGKYDGVLIFTIATSLFFYWYLKLNYNNKYVFDIRDHSPLMKYPFVRNITHKLLKNSALNCISSEGFKEWLPKDIDYVISHNINLDLLNERYSFIHKESEPIKVLTIGSIRDYESNLDIINQIANSHKFELSFIGHSSISPKLELYVKEKNIKNVFFHGRYYKKDEMSIISQYDMMNIYLPDNVLSNHLMTNRFYLSALMCKPMIVNDRCFQAKVASEYGLGIVFKRNDKFNDVLSNYWSNINIEEYENNCVRYIQDVKSDILLYEEKLNEYIKNICNK